MVRLLSGLLLVLAFSGNLLASQLTTEEKLLDFHQLWASIKSGYGPYQYKKDVQRIDLEQLKDRYLEKIKQSKTSGEYYYLIVQFVASFHDGHFVARIPTDHIRYLPITTDLVDGKVLVTAIDEKELPKDKFDFTKGDEIISLNQEPVLTVVENIKTYIGSGYDLTKKELPPGLSLTGRQIECPYPQGRCRLLFDEGLPRLLRRLSWIG